MLKATTDSHLDHSLTIQQLSFILAAFRDKQTFFLETITLPSHLGQLPCGLYGPLMGDLPVPDSEVILAPRPPRGYHSRLIRRPTRPARLITVIGGPHLDDPCILYTAFGGPATPKEPGDPSLDGNLIELAKSQAFWAEHALAL